MIDRATLKVRGTDVGYLSVDISWVTHHPGDQIEQSIKAALQDLTDNSTIITVNSSLVCILWNGTLGFCVVLNTIQDDLHKLEEEAYIWAQYVNQFIDGLHIGNLSVINTEISTEMPAESVNLSLNWFEQSLKGGTIELDRADTSFALSVANILGYFPWSLFFITNGRCTDQSVQFLFKAAISDELDLTEYFDRIVGDFDRNFWTILYHFVIVCHHQPLELAQKNWFTYLQAAHDFTLDEIDVVDQVSIMIKYQDLLSDLPPDFFHDFIETFLSKLTIQTSTYGLCKMLLQLSDVLLEKGYVDLAKLSEATVLEHSVVLVNPEHQKDVLIALVKRSSRWGREHLVAFIRSIVGIFSDINPNLISELIALVEDDLKTSWDGLMSLVELSIHGQNLDEAVKLRFTASQQIQNLQARADDIHAAVFWAIQNDMPIQSLVTYAFENLAYAFDYSESNVLLEQIHLIVQTCVKFEKTDFLALYLKFVRKKIADDTIMIPSSLLDTIQSELDEDQYLTTIIEILLIRMILSHRKGNEEGIFQYTTQLFNRINPMTDYGLKNLEYATREIIIFAAKINLWPLIQEASRRFRLMVQDKQYWKHSLKQSYLAGLNFYFENAVRSEPQKIGIELFNELLANCNLVNDYELLLPLMPKIKKLALSLSNYSEFSDILSLEMKLQKTLGNQWIPTLLRDLKQLIDKQQYGLVSNIFAETKKLDLTQDEAYELLAKELELAEIDTDFLSSTEIFEKRRQLISISQIGQHNIALTNFRQGVSELMTKGDSIRVNQFALDAIKYSWENNLKEYREFIDILQDNFKNLVEEYQDDPTTDRYYVIIDIWRQDINALKDLDFSLSLMQSIFMIEANLALHKIYEKNQFLRRIQLQFKEMGIIIDGFSREISSESVDHFIHTYQIISSYIVKNKPDFGIYDVIFDSAQILVKLNQPMILMKEIDTAINSMKREVSADQEALSGIFTLLYTISEVFTITQAVSNKELQNELNDRASKVAALTLSYPLPRLMKKSLKNFKKSLVSKPESALHDFAVSIESYLRDLGNLQVGTLY